MHKLCVCVCVCVCLCVCVCVCVSESGVLMGDTCGVQPVTRSIPVCIMICQSERKSCLLDGRHSFITSFSPASGFRLVCHMFEYLTFEYICLLVTNFIFCIHVK